MAHPPLLLGRYSVNKARATLRQDLDDTATLYGKPLENREIVTTGVRAPAAAAKLIALLNRYSARERTE
jgi:hypothetical protein